jgi:apolipoprotein N-acyltransferase
MAPLVMKATLQACFLVGACVQIALFVPFYLWGRKLLLSLAGASPSWSWEELPTDWARCGESLLPAQMAALAGWLCLAPLILAVSYRLALCLLKRREHADDAPAAANTIGKIP